MTTNPQGRIFISYRRLPHRIVEADLLQKALHERGMHTWRDQNNLESKPTEVELVRILNDQDTAGAVMLVSSEVADSKMIQKVEAPHILKRHHDNNGFIIKPVLIGIDYAEADRVLGSPGGFQNLDDWNLHRLKEDSFGDDNAQYIANQLLKARLTEISKRERDHPLDLRLYTRTSPDPDLIALCLDYSHYFNGRDAAPEAYNRIEKALVDTADKIVSVYGKAEINVEGFAALPIGVLFGSIFSPLRGFRVNVSQALAGQSKETWSLDAQEAAKDLTFQTSMGDPASEDVVLALSISANIEHAVREYLNAASLRPRASIHVQLPDGILRQGQALGPEEGLSTVLQSIDAVRSLKDIHFLKRINLHLFLACPLAMAVLIGQKLNTISQCSVYEHTPSGDLPYVLAHTFKPSDL